MNTLEVVVAIVIAVGIAGTILPILPGVLLVAGAITVWAWQTGGQTAWVCAGLAIAVLALGQVVKYLVPGRRLSRAGVPNSTLVAGGAGALVGFFVIPVVGALVGFPVGVYLAERARTGPDEAWPSTKQALRAVGLSILIELGAALLASVAWIAGVVAT